MSCGLFLSFYYWIIIYRGAKSYIVLYIALAQAEESYILQFNYIQLVLKEKTCSLKLLFIKLRQRYSLKGKNACFPNRNVNFELGSTNINTNFFLWHPYFLHFFLFFRLKHLGKKYSILFLKSSSIIKESLFGVYLFKK